MRRKSKLAYLLVFVFALFAAGCKGNAPAADTTAVAASGSATTRAAGAGTGVVINLPKEPTEGMHCYKCFTRVDANGHTHTDCSEIPCPPKK
jgi:hypothetical protein